MFYTKIGIDEEDPHQYLLPWQQNRELDKKHP
jgi:hypothetical protein